MTVPPISSHGRAARAFRHGGGSPNMGPSCSRRFSPLFTGVGPVEAAAATAAALAALASPG